MVGRIERSHCHCHEARHSSIFTEKRTTAIPQNMRVTVFPASLELENVAGLPSSRIADSANMAPVE